MSRGELYFLHVIIFAISLNIHKYKNYFLNDRFRNVNSLHIIGGLT